MGVRPWVLASAAAAAMACGPSFQAVYEGDVRFEHCYALDQEAVPVDAKKECWRDWLRGYTYGQSRDRVEYAATRLSALSLDPTLPREDTDPKPARTNAGPVPTSAFAPPPNLAEHPAPDPPAAPQASAAKSAAPALRTPGQDCTDGCTDRFRTCRGACKAAACDACDKTYKTCVPGCLRK